MRKLLVTAISGMVALCLSVPAEAATKTVKVVDNGDFAYNPVAVSLLARGDSVVWDDDSSAPHTATSNAPFSLFDKSIPDSGVSTAQVFVAAGVYPYFCKFHSEMKGSVKVPIALTKSGTTVTITVAKSATPSGFEYVVQKKGPGDTAFKPFKTIKTATTTFVGATGSTYSFRSKMKRVGSTASSLFSAAKAITV